MRFKWIIQPGLLVMSVWGMLACTSIEPGPLDEVTIIPESMKVSSSASRAKRSLEALLKERPNLRMISQPLFNYFDARHQESLGHWDLAQEAWLRSLKEAEHPFGEIAFRGWVASYRELLKKNVSAPVLAKLLLAETSGGQASPYMREQGLGDETKLIARISLLLDAGSIGDEPAGPPSQPGVPADDPLMKNLVQTYCWDTDKQAWSAWVRGLTPAQQRYWSARVVDCDLNVERSIAALKRSLDTLRKEPVLQLGLLEQLIYQYRQIGDREAAAAAYQDLAEIFLQNKITARDLSLEDLELLYQKANHFLWTARYRSMIGDYLNARKFVQLALNTIDDSFQNEMPESEADRFEELKAESYHILAYRISYELGDFESALVQTKLGKQLNRLNSEWTDRFAWYEGWYEMLSGRPSKAQQAWQLLLEATDDRRLRSQLRFWLARISAEQGQEDQALSYISDLCEEDSLGFYAVYALSVWQESPVKVCQSLSESMQGLVETSHAGSGMKIHQFDLDELLSNPKTRQLVTQTEIAIMIQADDIAELLARTSLDELRRLGKPEDLLESYLYVSRLLHAAGAYFKAMGLSYEIGLVDGAVWQRFPEQLHVLYPQPFVERFQRQANRFFVPIELLLALARQESGFRPAVDSPAGAIGLLQLMPETARRTASTLGEPTTPLPEDLRNVEINLKLGSAYFASLKRRYQSQLPKAIAAYNAGEYVVDRWVERRKADDPLVWMEGIPFGETKNYVKSVLRNQVVYQYIRRSKALTAQMLP